MRELFIDELAEVRGGVDPFEKLRHLIEGIEDLLVTTTGLCEEGPVC